MRDPLIPKESDALKRLSSRFPGHFTWGVATSAFQIEGAVAIDGRGPSIWDTFCARPGAIIDGSNADVACDHYHRLDEDLDLIASLGVDAYRFSIAWPRVQPLGTGDWNERGLAFYERLLVGLRHRGIQAHATLYHWDLPQALQDSGGWAQRDICGHFCEYASGILREFGDDLASVATFNEPWVVSVLGHEQGIFAPGVKNRHTAMLAAHHQLLAHGMVVRALRESDHAVPVGIVLNLSPVHPQSSSSADAALARRDDGLLNRWYLDALLRGAYPQDILDHLGDDAPAIHAGDMGLISQDLDFLGINYYTRSWADAQSGVGKPPPDAALTDMGWEIHPAGLSQLLVRLRHDYRLPPLYITENGAAFPDTLENGQVDDADRVNYLLSHWAAVADARDQGVDVRGYFVWSLFDNFEWASGLSKRFGIVYVDYQTLQRTLKRSARMFAEFLRCRALSERAR